MKAIPPKGRVVLALVALAAVVAASAVLRPRPQSHSPSSPKKGALVGGTAVLQATSAEPHSGLRKASPGPVQLGSETRVREVDGHLSVVSGNYAGAFERETVRFSALSSRQGGAAPLISYSIISVTVSGLELHLEPDAEPRADASGREVLYPRGSIEEKYVVKPEGLEQIFVLWDLPEGRGEVVVRGRVSTDLETPAPGSHGRKLAFRSAASNEEIFFSDAVAVDAAGRKCPLELAYQAGEISISVPAGWMKDAKLPVEIDPLVGSSFQVRSPTRGAPVVAYNSVANEWCVAWVERLDTTVNVLMAQRVSPSGTLIGSATQISVEPGLFGKPAISYLPSVNRYLVCWDWLAHTYPDSPPWELRGRVLNADATPFSPGDITLTTEHPAQYPSVATDGTQWFVCWELTVSGNFPFPTYIHGRFLAADGTLGTESDPEPSSAFKKGPVVAFTNGTYLIVWEQTETPPLANWYMAYRTMDAAGTFTTSAGTFAGSGALLDGVPAYAVAGGPNDFTIFWQDSSYVLKGQRVTAAGTTTGYDTFIINASGAGVSTKPCLPAAAYSQAGGQYLLAYGAPDNSGNLLGNAITPPSTVGGVDPITSDGNANVSPAVAWNSAADTFLVAYEANPSSPFQVRAQVVSLSGPSAVLQGRWRFDEGTGTVAHDSSGAGNDGTLTGGVTWAAGKSGTAISLDGSGGYVEVPVAGLPAIGAAQSISWWMNYSSVPAGSQCVIGLTNDQAASAVQCGFRGGQVTIWSFGGGILAQALAPTPGIWHHFAYTFSGSVHRLYVDGVEVANSTATLQTAAPAKLEFGRWSGGAEYYAGLLDEVRIYGGTLTASEVAALAADGALEAYFKFDEGAGATAHDSSGNGHTGTLNNGATWSSGRSGTALSLDGSDDNVSCVLGTGLPANNAPQTISWWMNYPSVPVGVQAAVCLTNPGANSAVQTGFRNDQVAVWNWGGNTLVSAPAPQPGAWHHFAYTYDGSTHTLYVDGSAVNTSSAAAQAAVPSRFDFGFTPGWAENFLGSLDEVRIYSRALSGGEIASLARAYSLEAYFKFDEGSGITTADSSGNGHTGTLADGASWATGKSGSALSLDGTSGTVSCALGANLPANNAPQTISWWMNYSAPPGGVQSMIGLTNPTAGSGSAVQCGFRNGALTVWNWGGNTLVSASEPSANAWHHAAYTFDGTTHTLYVDGVSVSSSTAGAQTASPSRLDFGLTPGWGEYYAGVLDEVRIYSRALSASEVAALALDPSLAAYLKFDEGNGLLAADSSGNGHTGTLSGGAGWTTGASGSALLLNGSSYVVCNAGSGLPANNSVQSIAWWMNVPSVPSTVQTVVGLTNSPAGSAVQVGFRNSQVTVWNWGGNTLVSASPPSVGTWHHVAYSFDGTTHTLYIDGTAAATSTVTAQSGAPNRLDIGFTPGWGEFLAGAVDDVRIYTRTLTVAEIQGLIQGTRPLAPVITSPGTGATLTQAQPPVSGTSTDAGLGITLFVDGSPNGTAVSGNQGAWLIYPSIPIPDGLHNLTATAANGAGASPASSGVGITVNAGSNTQLIISNVTIQNGGFVNNAQPLFSVILSNPNGTGINPSTIVVQLDGNVVNATTTVIDGNTISVSFTPTAALTQGGHVITIDGLTGTGGVIATLVDSFVIDTSLPLVMFSSPRNGSSFASGLIPVDVMVSDQITGLSSVHLVLNNVDLTSSLSQTSGPFSLFGAPLSIRLQGLLSTVLPTNVMTVSGTDLAGNTSSSSVSFTTFTTPETPVALAIELISGDGQSGLTGKGLQNDLVVSAVE